MKSTRITLLGQKKYPPLLPGPETWVLSSLILLLFTLTIPSLSFLLETTEKLTLLGLLPFIDSVNSTIPRGQ